MTISLTKRLRTFWQAVAVSATALFCTNPNAAPLPCGQTDVIDRLFEFSQRAERPKDQEHESLNCPDKGTPLLPVSRQRVKPIPSSTASAVTKKLNVLEGRGTPFAESSPDNMRLHIVCPKHFGIDTLSIPLDIAVEMMVLQSESGAEIVRSDVVTRVPADPEKGRAEGEWTHVIGPEGTITFPGTDPLASKQLLANFFGEKCVFPAAHLALYALCTPPDTAPANDGPVTARTPTTSNDPANGWVRPDKNGRPTVVGHSLGGAVTQYIATTAPPEPPSTDGGSQIACSGVNAYTFGSTGLTADTAGAAPTIHGELWSYASDCDHIVHSVPKFPGRVQPGRVFTLPSYSHWIDEIQADLCKCREPDGTEALHDHGTRRQPPQNSSLVGLTRGSNGYCPARTE